MVLDWVDPMGYMGEDHGATELANPSAHDTASMDLASVGSAFDFCTCHRSRVLDLPPTSCQQNARNSKLESTPAGEKRKQMRRSAGDRRGPVGERRWGDGGYRMLEAKPPSLGSGVGAWPGRRRTSTTIDGGRHHNSRRCCSPCSPSSCRSSSLPGVAPLYLALSLLPTTASVEPLFAEAKLRQQMRAKEHPPWGGVPRIGRLVFGSSLTAPRCPKSMGLMNPTCIHPIHLLTPLMVWVGLWVGGLDNP